MSELKSPKNFDRLKIRINARTRREKINVSDSAFFTLSPKWTQGFQTFTIHIVCDGRNIWLHLQDGPFRSVFRYLSDSMIDNKEEWR